MQGAKQPRLSAQLKVSAHSGRLVWPIRDERVASHATYDWVDRFETVKCSLKRYLSGSIYPTCWRLSIDFERGHCATVVFNKGVIYMAEVTRLERKEEAFDPTALVQSILANKRKNNGGVGGTETVRQRFLSKQEFIDTVQQSTVVPNVLNKRSHVGKFMAVSPPIAAAFGNPWWLFSEYWGNTKIALMALYPEGTSEDFVRDAMRSIWTKMATVYGIMEQQS